MLGIGGRFAGAKGMVQMPNLANLSPTAATAAITAAGLRLGTASEVESSVSSNNEKVFVQSISAGTLVDYEAEVNYSYYRYVPPAIVYTLDTSQKIQDGSPTVESGCNQTPNLQNASNSFFFCTRTLTQYKYRLLANGVWDGVSYGGYFTEYSTWNCGIEANRCGNTELAPREISRSACIGTPGTTGYQDVVYERVYLAGSPTGIRYTQAVSGCQVPQARFEVSRSTSFGPCSASGIGGCYCGQQTVTTTIIYNTGSPDTITSTQCCPNSSRTVTTANFYESCNNSTSQRRCTYRTYSVDCLGNEIAGTSTRYECAPIPCGCSSTAGLVSCTDWSGSSGGQSRTCTYRNPDCTTYSVVETRCAAGCGTWTNSSSCVGGRRTQTRTCTRTDCSTYSESRTVSC